MHKRAMADILTTTFKQEAQEVADMIKAATSSLMQSTQTNETAIRCDEQNRHDETISGLPTNSGNTDNKNETGENFRASVESFFRAILGSCGGVLEAASFLVKNSWKPSDENSTKDRRGTPRTVEVSNGRSESHGFWVTDDRKRRSLFQNARANSSGFPQTQEIPPPFRVGEDGEHCLDISQNFDDNISALSAHTLEEMALHNGSFRAEHVAVPPPITPASSSSGSSKGDDHNALPMYPSHPDHGHDVPDAYFIQKSRRALKKLKVSEAIREEEFGRVKFLPPRSPKRYLEV